MTQMSRRNFFAFASAGAVTATMGMSASATAGTKVPAKWDETVDVLIVGSGLAGMSAAVEASANKGLKILVLEKMVMTGGNSMINAGAMGVAGTPMQKKMGIKDSPELFAEDMFREGLGLGEPAHVRTVAEKSLDAWLWTRDTLGVEWNEDTVVAEGGHTVARGCITKSGTGATIVNKGLELAKKQGVQVRTRCYVEEIIREDGGRVLGLKVREGYRFPKAESGKVKYIRATKAVVLAHGGFGADVAYRTIHDPKLSKRFESTNQPGATGEMWRQASSIGCAIIQADWIQCGPWASPDEKGFGVGVGFAQDCCAMYGLWINTTTGERFVNELANRKVRADAIINLNNKNVECIALADTNAYEVSIKVSRPGHLEKCLDKGVVTKYATLEDVAKKFNIPLEALKKQVAAYNEDVKKKAVTDQMNRIIQVGAKPLEQGPWYVSRLSPKVHHCMGGIRIDQEGRALDVVTDKPIPGLFAAGEASGGTHGAVRLGTCSITECIVHGRIAGQSVAKL